MSANKLRNRCAHVLLAAIALTASSHALATTQITLDAVKIQLGSTGNLNCTPNVNWDVWGDESDEDWCIGSYASVGSMRRDGFNVTCDNQAEIELLRPDDNTLILRICTDQMFLADSTSETNNMMNLTTCDTATIQAWLNVDEINSLQNDALTDILVTIRHYCQQSLWNKNEYLGTNSAEVLINYGQDSAEYRYSLSTSDYPAPPSTGNAEVTYMWQNTTQLTGSLEKGFHISASLFDDRNFASLLSNQPDMTSNSYLEIEFAIIPEPASIALLGTGMLTLAHRIRKRKAA